jgi:hypothetical protein
MHIQHIITPKWNYVFTAWHSSNERDLIGVYGSWGDVGEKLGFD